MNVNRSMPRLRTAALAGAGFAAFYAAWLVWGSESGWQRMLVGGLSVVFAALLATAAAVWARQTLPRGAMRTAWSWLALGVAGWAASHLARLVAGLAGWQTNAAWLSAVYLAAALPLWVGLGRYPRAGRSISSRVGVLFDASLTTAAILTLTWLAALQPLPGGSFTGSLLYPLADLATLILLVNLFLISDAGSLPGPMGWLGLGLAANALGGITMARLASFVSVLPGSPADAGWVLGGIFVAIGGLVQVRLNLGAGGGPSGFMRGALNRLQSLLPLLAVLILGAYTLLTWQLSGRFLELGLWVVVVLGLGLIARQGLQAGEMEYRQYANLVNSIAEPAFVCDSRGRLRLVNPALLSAAGYDSPQQLLGGRLMELLSPGDEIPARVAEGMAGGWSGEVSLLRRDGTSLPISLALRPLTSGAGRSLALAGTAYDLSELKQQQSALLAAYQQITADRAELEHLNTGLERMVAEKTASLVEAYRRLEQQNLTLQQLDRIKSDFVSMVSHELRAPLTNISGGIELLLGGPQILPRRARENLSLVQVEIERLTRFVETILDLSALEAGRLPLYPAPVALEGVMQSIQRQMQHLPGVERIRWEVPADMPALLADERALGSILFHLVDNAIKYAPDGEIVVSAGVEEGRACVQVCDSGPGIRPDALPLLFDRFFRTNAGDAQVVYGHGLGLYIVQRLLEALAGEIRAENRPEGGARFSFWLPLAGV